MSEEMVYKMGHPILRQRAKEVETINDPSFQKMVSEMLTMIRDMPAAGLAAPQIGESLRVIVFQVHPVTAERKGIDPLPPMVLINPEIKPVGKEKYDDWEACLSLGDLMGIVPRFQRIAYKGLNEKGQKVSGEATGHHARTIQHEYDHLEGILYIDRIKDLKNLIYRDQYDHWLAGKL